MRELTNVIDVHNAAIAVVLRACVTPATVVTALDEDVGYILVIRII